MKNIEGTYIYKTGNPDRERLAILNEVYNPSSQQIMLKSGMSSRKCIVDMACGQGELTCWMAEQAPASYIIGIDISQDQLRVANELAVKKGLKNIRFVQASIFDLDRKLLNGLEPDLIYCRWLLSHFNIIHAAKGMQKLYEILTPNGLTIHEEISLKDSYSNPSSPAYHCWITLFQDLAKSLDIDFDIGSELFTLASEAGYKEITHQIVKPKFLPYQKEFFNLDIDCSKPYLSKIKTEEELGSIKHAIIQDQKQGYEMTMTLHQIVGKK